MLRQVAALGSLYVNLLHLSWALFDLGHDYLCYKRSLGQQETFSHFAVKTPFGISVDFFNSVEKITTYM